MTFKLRSLKKILQILLFSTILIASYLTLTYFAVPQTPIIAYETDCPDHMTAEECLDYLQEQAEQIEEEQNKLDNSIEAENMEQLSLSEQIAYLAGQIEETELTIAEKELDIERKNVEIQLLGEDIVDLQNSIDTIVQEINNLQEVIDNRTTSSYKLTFVSPLEILLDSQNFETMMHKSKYLIETKKKDRELMSDLATSKKDLEKEETILTEKKEQIQEKRNKVEEQMASLAEDKKNLENQKSHQNELLAESKRREQELLATLRSNQAAQEEIDKTIAQKIQEMFDNGEIGEGTRISAGTAIGQMGNTGCSYGAHLHFSIDDGNTWVCYGNIDPWAGYLSKGPDYWAKYGGWYYYYVRPTGVHTPLQGQPILTQDFHQGTAIDLVTTDDHGNLIGEGALVYSIKGGTFWSGVDACGGKFAVVEHDDGTRSCYLHLK
jgi:peptidoglycan hydrolase CwlO-like protein